MKQNNSYHSLPVELINYTIVVFLVTIFIALIISVLDGLFAQLFNTLLHFVG
ncbi:MAG: preprotein translocase subunit SecE [Veillonella sp.]|nr:preprotein translocase subunit SecE [Veillonella sp.]